MPTIKDIAREAGVSYGTVSNVLNKKGNVRTDKIKKVEEAIRRLGYSVNESAKTLRQKRRNAIGLLVPDMRSRHYINLYESINSQMRSYDYAVEIFSTGNLYQHEKELVKKMVSANVNCIVAFPTYINSHEIYDKIPESVYLVIIGPQPRGVLRPYLSVTFDYEQIGRDIASYVIRKGYKNAALLIDSVRFSESFALSIKRGLGKSGVSLKMYGSTPRNAVIRAFDFWSERQDYDVIITSNLVRARAVRQAYGLFSPAYTPEIITLSSSNTIFEDENTCVYLDYTRLGNIVSENLIQILVEQKTTAASLVIDTEGLNRRVLKIPHFVQQKALNILAPESYCSRALQKLLPQFVAKSGTQVNLSIYPADGFHHLTHRLRQNHSCDILISDINHFQRSTRDAYLKKQDSPEVWRHLQTEIDVHAHYFPAITQEHLCYSFNAACQMLFYRFDLFGDHGVRRLFYESFYRDLALPKTLREYDEIAHFFSRAINPMSPLLYGTSMSSLNTESFLDELCGRLLLGGFQAPAVGDRLNWNQPSIAEGIRAFFQNLSASNAASPQLSSLAFEDFFRGNSLMSIFSTANAAALNENELNAMADCIKCSDVPGNLPVVSCDVIGMVEGCDKLEEAAAFLTWVFHDSISHILTLLCGQPIRKSSTTNAEILTLYPWLKHFNHTVEDGKILSDAMTPVLYDSGFRGELLMALSNCYNRPSTMGESLARIQESYERHLDT